MSFAFINVVVILVNICILGGKLSREASSVSLKGGTKGGGDEGSFQIGDTVWVAGTKKGILR